MRGVLSARLTAEKSTGKADGEGCPQKRSADGKAFRTLRAAVCFGFAAPQQKMRSPKRGAHICCGQKRTAGRFRLAVNFDLSVCSKTNISLALII